MDWSAAVFSSFLLASTTFTSSNGQGIQMQPPDSPLHVQVGADLQLSCTGAADMSLQWFRNDAYITNTLDQDISISTQNINGPGDVALMMSTLRKANVVRDDGGVYECRPFPPTGDGSRKEVIVVSRSSILVRHDSLYGDNRFVLGCLVEGASSPVQWFRAGSTTQLDTSDKYLIDTQRGTLTIRSANIRDVGDYACRISQSSYYIKEQHATLSCMPGYSREQSFGCYVEENNQPACETWGRIANAIIPQRTQHLSMLNMQCVRNDLCTGLKCSVDINLRRLDPGGEETFVRSRVCFGLETQPCTTAITFHTDASHTVNPHSQAIRILAARYEVAEQNRQEDSFITINQYFYQNNSKIYNRLSMKFNTEIRANSSTSWPAELSLDILPVTLVPYPQCTNTSRPLYSEVCGAQVNLQDPMVQITPVPTPTTVSINNQVIFVPTLQTYDPTTNAGYQRFCEGSNVELECPLGHSMRVARSTYGRLVSYSDDTVCSYNGNGARDTTDCQANTTSAMQSRCDGKQYCEVIADDGLNGNPCGNVNKYLDVIFLCVPDAEAPVVLCSNSQFRCRSAQCIPHAWLCDRYTDCIDGTDEQDCPDVEPPSTTVLTPPQTTRLSIPSDAPTIVCEGDALEIECPASQIIRITTAEFGHWANVSTKCDSDVTNVTSIATCTKDSVLVMSERCDNLNSCKVQATTDTFGTNCTGVPKYLNVTYQCVVMRVTPPPVPSTTANARFCFARHDNWNAVWGLITNQPQAGLFFFGHMEDNIEACERFCFNEPRCMAYAYYTSAYSDKRSHGNVSFAGRCYGRSIEPTTLYYIPEANVQGGFLKQHFSYCAESRSAVNSDLRGNCIDKWVPNLEERHWYIPVDLHLFERNSVVFSVKACHNAYVALSSNPIEQFNGFPSADISYMYEIFLGENNNTKSGIRINHKRRPNQKVEDHDPILDCNEYRTFWISWKNDVKVGLGDVVGRGALFTLRGSSALWHNTHPVKELAVFNGYGASAHWRFCDGLRPPTTLPPSVLKPTMSMTTVKRRVLPTSEPRICKANEFTCKNYRCIPKKAVCDAEPDCMDGDDEIDCPPCGDEENQVNCYKAGEVTGKENDNNMLILILGIVGGVLFFAIVIGAIVGTVVCRRQAALKRSQEEFAAAGYTNGPKPTVHIEPKSGITRA